MLAHKAQNTKDQQQAMQLQTQQMLLTEQAKHPPKTVQPKPVSESINFADLGPSGKLQVGQQAGLDLTADVAADLAAEHMGAGKKTPPKPNGKVPPNSAKVPLQ